MLTTDKSDFALEDRIGRAARALIDRQQADGHWVFELEADATIPAEYVLMRHFRGEPLDDGTLATMPVVFEAVSFREWNS